MKKIFAIILSAALVFATAVCTSAATVNEENGTDSATVKGTYAAGSASSEVLSVDITWGSMEFTYTGASQGTWNPKTHSYTGTTTAGWSCESGANVIKVTNHSNVDVIASMSYASEAAYSGINGEFSKNSVTLDSAVGHTVADAPTDSAELTLEGELTNKNASNENIGTVTVQLG